MTVLTPTFNREALLERVYRSLDAQSFHHFEWLIVDDGSTDGTYDAVKGWMDAAAFPIRYVRQDNAGKHVALNRGVALARGSLVLVLDSDDLLQPGALERIWATWKEIPEERKDSFAGVAGLYAYPSGRIVGTEFPVALLDSNAVEIRTRFGVRGDKLEVYRTDVLQRFPFPEDRGRFVTEGLVWNRIARVYGLRFVNEVWGTKEYQTGGLTDKSVALRAASPRAARLYYREFTEMEGMGISIGLRVRQYANFVRFSLHAGILFVAQAREVRHKMLWVFSLPVGIGVFLRDLVRLTSSGRVSRSETS